MNIPEKLIPDHKTQKEAQEFYDDCNSLWKCSVKEFFDNDFATRSHFNHKTNQVGCSGPLCMAATRITNRKYNGGNPTEYWSVFEPILSYFFSVILIEQNEFQNALQHSLTKEIMYMPNYCTYSANQTVKMGYLTS